MGVVDGNNGCGNEGAWSCGAPEPGDLHLHPEGRRWNPWCRGWGGMEVPALTRGHFTERRDLVGANETKEFSSF